MVDYAVINKPSAQYEGIDPNLEDYSSAREGFDWYRDGFSQLDWLPGGGLNNAYEAIDRHVAHGHGDKQAMIWVGKNWEEEKYTYSDMKDQSDRFGAVMNNLGIERADRVFIFMDRLPELYFAALGVLKAGGVIGPLFSAFGPDPVLDRMVDAGARYLITTPELRKKIAEILPKVETLEKVIIVDKDGRSGQPLVEGDLDYYELMAAADPSGFQIANTSQYDYSIMHYTSGSTGKPKGVLHRHQAVVQQYMTGKWCLDLNFGDMYFCTADPGWVTGTSYGMMAPWTNGVINLIYEGGFGANAYYDIIDKYKVTVWYTAPTAVRLLMRAGSGPVESHDLSSLRFIASVGEPLNPKPSCGATRTTRWRSTTTGGRPRPGRSCARTMPRWRCAPAQWAGRFPASKWRCWTRTTTPSKPGRPESWRSGRAGRR